MLKEIIKNEVEVGLYDIKVLGIPLWRLLRFKLRVKYLNSKTGFTNKTTVNKVPYFSLIKNIFLSGIYIFKIYFLRNKNFDNLVFAFPRLHKFSDEYLDKFTDPLIAHSKIKDNCLIFQRPLAGSHKSLRYNSKLIVKTDFIEVFSMITGLLIFPFILIFYYSLIKKMYNKIENCFESNITTKFSIAKSLANYVVYYNVYSVLIKKIKPKRVFLVDREIFFPIITVCKKLKINVYELQHGVTHCETPLYSGLYDESIDPDFFLVFGSAWIGPQFGIPKDKIINIGWAYHDFFKKRYSDIKLFDDKTVLLVSSPEITDKIIKVSIELSKKYLNHIFHIRLHPQETLNKAQLEKIDEVANICIQDNSMESSIVILSYNSILGENSSVLYEALSAGKKVGRLNMMGLKSDFIEGTSENDFILINNIQDFEVFCSTNRTIKSTKLFYSAFNEEIVNNLK